MHSATHRASIQISLYDIKRGWLFQAPALNATLDVVALADRRGAKNSTGSSNRKQQQRRGKNGSDPPSGSRGDARSDGASWEAQRGRELQRAARRASARAEDVGGGRLALQERLLASQVTDGVGGSDDEDDDGDGWAAVAAAATSGNWATGLPIPLPPQGVRAGGDSSATSTGHQRNRQELDAEEELWPSREAVAGPVSESTNVDAEAEEVVHGVGNRRRRRGGSVATNGTPGLVQALRAAQVVDRQNRMLSGGGGLGVAAMGRGHTDTGDGQGATDVHEDLVPYVDVALKELGLPARPRSGTRGSSQNRQLQQQAEQLYQSPRESEGEDGEKDDDNGEGGSGSGGAGLRSSRRSPTRGRGVKRGALRDLLATYQRIWCKALDLELQEEWTESEERLKSWKRPRLEAEGYALFDLTAAPDHNLFRDAILRFFQPGRPLPYHCLGTGDIVLVSANNRPGEASMEGIVLDFSSRWIRIALPADIAHGVQGGNWRLDLYANTIAHERARGAVKRYCQAAAESGSNSSGGGSKGNGSGSDSDESSSSSGGGGGGSLSILRALASNVPSGATLEQMAAAPPPWVRGKAGRERLTAARRVVAAATAAAAVKEVGEPELPLFPPPPSPLPHQPLPAATGLPFPAGAAVSRASDGGGGSGSRGGERRRAAGLNASQARAIETALGQSLTLWQGPPGTGKTATLLQFIRAALAALPSGSGPVLATAASNVAVDNLVSGLRALDPSLDVVRVGQPVKVAPELRGVSLEARIAGTAAGQRAARLRRQAQGLRGAEAWTYISQALELEEAAARDILSNAQVVAATCIGCGEARMQALSFPVVVLDEATQATEPHSLVPLLGQVRQVVLVGDPQQLPPTVKSQEAAELGLNIPLFERLQFMGLAPLLLDTQYRMHPAIAAFPSAAFYGGRLRSAPDPRDRRPPAAFPWPNPKVPVCFIPVRGRELRTNVVSDAATPGGAAGYSYQNNDEAEAAAAVVAALMSPGSASGLDGPGDIGIVTPYNGQVRCLQQLLTQGSRLSRGLGLGARPGSFLRSPTTTATAPGSDRGAEGPSGEGSALEIKSVDGFQGREKEVIVFSTVRSNPEGRLGFLTDSRRLNVAITRARRGLVVLGNPDTLARDRLWARWLRWVTSQGCVLEGWGAGGAAGVAAVGFGAGGGGVGRAGDKMDGLGRRWSGGEVAGGATVVSTRVDGDMRRELKGMGARGSKESNAGEGEEVSEGDEDEEGFVLV